MPFITLEGIDGCGKSTQARLVAAALKHAGHEVVSLREPGGVAISEKIRALLLDPENKAMCDTCELLLYEAARAQLVHEIVRPALAEGKVVVCDRFFDSTSAYQAFAGTVAREDADVANALAVGDCVPDLTLVFDIDPAAAASRREQRDDAPDRMEAKGLEYQQRVADGFRTISREHPERVRLVDATQPIDAVFACVLAELAGVGLAVSADDARSALSALMAPAE
ncbi:dTMP kinase [Collinsella sp. An271]|uniref:dTMP kinase n=1 Tax=Collinsella sp. An271 TaxID=1965616 RepID=UPI000B393A16|nr:dTMP kinase [Collinsella sp. An271]OUO61832.1 dTMP kinase [Collinsella sp. An271]